MEINKVIHGDCLEKLKLIPDNSVDAIVTDPPYELGFMGKRWDNTGIAYNVEMWKECFRVLKSGGHLLAFGGTRTYHRMAVAIEDAGFEIRDMIEWVYGSGFPKSLNIGKAIDKLKGNKREIFIRTDGKGSDSGSGCYNMNSGKDSMKKEFVDSKGNSEWEGWGTALKPAHEPICMARKPISEKNVALNVLKYGTGGINIDDSRIGIDKHIVHGGGSTMNPEWGFNEHSMSQINKEVIGRFPANFIHDGSPEVVQCFPDSDGAGNSLPQVKITGYGDKIGNGKCDYFGGDRIPFESGSGNASRFFKSIIYTAKASSDERNDGMDKLELKPMYKGDGSSNSLEIFGSTDGGRQNRKNNHPTVKPIELIEYLVNMVSREGQTVLDPFAGSGTTLVVSKKLRRNFIGIEITEEYIPIIQARVDNVKVDKNIFGDNW